MIVLACLLAAQTAAAPLPDNAYVRVARNAAPCASAAAGCGRRILVALGPVQVHAGSRTATLARGEIMVFDPDESYSVDGAAYVEVAVKHGHPRATRPAGYEPPAKNATLYDGDELFVFEERLAPGDTRPRHGHGQRVVIVVNETRLQQWQDDGKEVFKNQVPDDVHFNEPVAHRVKNVGPRPLRNIVIEFKP